MPRRRLEEGQMLSLHVCRRQGIGFMWQMSRIPVFGALQFGSSVCKEEATRLEKEGNCTQGQEKCIVPDREDDAAA